MAANGSEIQAASEDRDALFAVLGSDLDALISADPVADAADRRRFVELSREAAHLEDETEDSAILVIGPEDWPFPIPLAKDDQGWYLDTQAGLEELLDRCIGLNELHAVATARAFVDAQMEYAAADPDGDGMRACEQEPMRANREGLSRSVTIRRRLCVLEAAVCRRPSYRSRVAGNKAVCGAS